MRKMQTFITLSTGLTGVVVALALLAPLSASTEGLNATAAANAAMKSDEIVAKLALKPTVLASLLTASTAPLPGVHSKGQPAASGHGCSNGESSALTSTSKPESKLTWR